MNVTIIADSTKVDAYKYMDANPTDRCIRYKGGLPDVLSIMGKVRVTKIVTFGKMSATLSNEVLSSLDGATSYRNLTDIIMRVDSNNTNDTRHLDIIEWSTSNGKMTRMIPMHEFSETFMMQAYYKRCTCEWEHTYNMRLDQLRAKLANN